MAIDRLGGVDLTIVYCTLCGTVVPYESTVAGRQLRFGTSGLLYRSNKLMFDEETASLWSALEGVPVVGPLAGSGIRLPFHAVVTTTWGEWKREHQPRFSHSIPDSLAIIPRARPTGTTFLPTA